MSKIGSDKMKAAIHEMLTTNHKDRKFQGEYHHFSYKKK